MDSLIRAFYEVPGKVVAVRKERYLFREGTDAQYFYFVRKGKICIQKSVPTGRVLALRLASPGQIIGELPLYQTERSYIFDAVAKVDSEVYAIEYPILEAYLEKKPALAVQMLKILAHHMRKQHLKFRDLVLFGKKGAVYSTLIRMANSYGKEEANGILIPIRLTNQELADYSAMSRESLNRLLADLKKDGIVTMRGNFLLIRDLEFLRREIQCEACAKEDCIIE